jgi:hypothetical protein
MPRSSSPPTTSRPTSDAKRKPSASASAAGASSPSSPSTPRPAAPGSRCAIRLGRRAQEREGLLCVPRVVSRRFGVRHGRQNEAHVHRNAVGRRRPARGPHVRNRTLFVNLVMDAGHYRLIASDTSQRDFGYICAIGLPQSKQLKPLTHQASHSARHCMRFNANVRRLLLAAAYRADLRKQSKTQFALGMPTHRHLSEVHIAYPGDSLSCGQKWLATSSPWSSGLPSN